MADNCIYRSVTMAAGETFVLPPGAELISASDSNAITNSCETPIPTVPTKCWRIGWVVNEDPEGDKVVGAHVVFPPFGAGPGLASISIPGTGNAWESGDGDGTDWIKILKVGIGGNIATTDILVNDFTALENAIALSPAGGLLSDRKYNSYFKEQGISGAQSLQWGDFWKSGYHILTIHFKATEEVAKTVYLEFASSVDPADLSNVGSIPRYFAAEVECADYPSTSLVTTC